MKLNPNCIRDILLYIEQVSDGFATYAINSHIVKESNLLCKYDYDEFSYHIQQCNQHGFLVGYTSTIYYSEYAFQYRDLTPLAHSFLANIRENKVWKKSINIANKIGSKSLDAIIQIASNVVSDLIKSEFNIH